MNNFNIILNTSFTDKENNAQQCTVDLTFGIKHNELVLMKANIIAGPEQFIGKCIFFQCIRAEMVPLAKEFTDRANQARQI